MSENVSAGRVQSRARTLVSRPALLQWITPHELQSLRDALARGCLPPDFVGKLKRLKEGNLSHHFIEQNCRLFAALLVAMEEGSFREGGPAERVRLAADSMVGTDSGLFATLFHGCLDPSSGTLRYVDAGHGYCVILRRDNELERLPERSMPLGVLTGQDFLEGVTHLGPGDSLLVYSDGLVETEDRTVQPQELTAGLDESMHAAEVVRRLIARMPPSLSDDVTAVALHRLSESPPMAGAATGHAHATSEDEGGL